MQSLRQLSGISGSAGTYELMKLWQELGVI